MFFDGEGNPFSSCPGKFVMLIALSPNKKAAPHLCFITSIDRYYLIYPIRTKLSSARRLLSLKIKIPALQLSFIVSSIRYYLGILIIKKRLSQYRVCLVFDIQ